MNVRAFAPVVLPYTRRELPAWGRIMRMVGGLANDGWSSSPLVRTQYKWTPYHVWLNLADPHERMVYFCGRYYDLGTQLALRTLLRADSTFVDIGANIGLMSVLAAHSVGRSGTIYSIEPNPDCCERLRLHIDTNRLLHVCVHQTGLSDNNAVLTLTRETDSSVHGSFAPPVRQSKVTARHEVSVIRGDDLLAEARADRAMVIKIDVEGFECRVVRGLLQTIDRHRPIILTEVVEEHLARAGSSPVELFELMRGLGYSGWSIGIRRRATRYRLNLVPVSAHQSMPPTDTDVLWRPKD